MTTATHEQHTCSIFITGDSTPFTVAYPYPQVLELWHSVRIAQAEQPAVDLAFVVPILTGPAHAPVVVEAAPLVSAITAVADQVLDEDERGAIVDAIMDARRARPELFPDLAARS